MQSILIKIYCLVKCQSDEKWNLVDVEWNSEIKLLLIRSRKQGNLVYNENKNLIPFGNNMLYMWTWLPWYCLYVEKGEPNKDKACQSIKEKRFPDANSLQLSQLTERENITMSYKPEHCLPIVILVSLTSSLYPYILLEIRYVFCLACLDIWLILIVFHILSVLIHLVIVNSINLFPFLASFIIIESWNFH